MNWAYNPKQNTQLHILGCKIGCNSCKSLIISLDCGAAGNRTLVQTRNPYAFYMLSFLLVFDDGPEKSTQAIAYPLEFSPFAKGGLRLTLY